MRIRIRKPETAEHEGSWCVIWPVEDGKSLYGLFYEVPERLKGQTSPCADAAVMALAPWAAAEGMTVESEAAVSRGLIRALGEIFPEMPAVEAPEATVVPGQKKTLLAGRGAGSLYLAGAGRRGLLNSACSCALLLETGMDSGSREAFAARFGEYKEAMSLAGFEAFYAASNTDLVVPEKYRSHPLCRFSALGLLSTVFGGACIGPGADAPGWDIIDAMSLIGCRLTGTAGASRLDCLEMIAESPELAAVFEPGSGEKAVLTACGIAALGKADAFPSFPALEGVLAHPRLAGALALAGAAKSGLWRDAWKEVCGHNRRNTGALGRIGSALCRLHPQVRGFRYEEAT